MEPKAKTGLQCLLQNNLPLTAFLLLVLSLSDAFCESKQMKHPSSVESQEWTWGFHYAATVWAARSVRESGSHKALQRPWSIIFCSRATKFPVQPHLYHCLLPSSLWINSLCYTIAYILFPDWQQISRIVGEWFCTQHLRWMLTQEQSKCRAQIRGFFFSHKLFLKQLCWSHTSLFAACSWTKFRDSISANYIWELQDVYKINCRTGCFYNAVLFSYHKHKVLFYWT